MIYIKGNDMKKQKFTEKFYLRITNEEKKQLAAIGKKLGFKSLSSFIRWIIHTECQAVLNSPEYFNAYLKEAHTGTLLLVP